MLLNIQKTNERIIKDMVHLGKKFFPEGHDNLNDNYLRWILNHNPFGESYVATAYEGDDLIGMITLIPIILRNDKETRQCYFAINVLTDPAHRNKNIFLKLADLCISFCSENCAWLIGHPNRVALPGWKRKKMNFRGVLFPHLKFPSLKIFSRKIKRVDKNEMVPSFDIDSFNNGWSINYTKEFIQWRYVSSPSKKYEIFNILDSNGQLEGFFVCRKFKFGIKLLVDHFDISGAFNVSHPTSFLLTLMPASVVGAGLNLPINKSIPFFVTTYGSFQDNLNFSRLTLGATDF